MKLFPYNTPAVKKLHSSVPCAVSIIWMEKRSGNFSTESNAV